ncbi:MAG: hypothetical protein ACKO3W_07765, partial [bacterium]
MSEINREEGAGHPTWRPTAEQKWSSEVEYGSTLLPWRPRRALDCPLGNPDVRLASLGDLMALEGG